MRVDFLRLLGPGGSNKLMAGELSRLARRALPGELSRELLRIPPKKVGPGSLRYPFRKELAYVACYYQRTCTRVLWDLYESEQTRLEPLFDELVADLAGEDRFWLASGRTFSIQAYGLAHMEAGERQVVGTVKNALLAAAERRKLALQLDAERPDLLFHLRALKPEDGPAKLVLSLDLIGRPMHERGYRTEAGIAPLREDLAAQLVMLLRYDARKEHLVDPMAGSGTIGIEASLMGAGRPLWMSGRSPRFETFPELAEQLSGKLRPLFADTQAALSLAEVDETTYDLQSRALNTAGVTLVDRFLGDFRDFRVKEFFDDEGVRKPRVVLCNPPYGARLDHEWQELELIYRDLGRFCRAIGARRAGFIVGEDEGSHHSVVRLFEHAFGGRPRVKKPMHNGQLRAQFLLYDWSE